MWLQQDKMAKRGQPRVGWGKLRGRQSVSAETGNRRPVGVSNQEPQPQVYSANKYLLSGTEVRFCIRNQGFHSHYTCL